MTFINFDEINLCTDIVNYVESINGAESNSASPTDTWILTFKPDAPIYHRYKRINNCFFKIFIDPSTIIEPSYEHLEYLNALTYELNVYSDVIYPLIKNNVCSNFVKYLSSGTNCTYNNLLQLLNLNRGVNDQNEQNLLRNILYMYEMYQGRFSINNNLHVPEIPTFDAKTLNYSILCTKNMNAKTLKKILNDVSLTRQNLLEIMFILSISCYVMSMCNMTHNDLHTENIFIETSSSINTYKYIIGENENDYDEYIIRSKYNTYIYDFDRAYVQHMGVNPLLLDWACDDYFQCNKYIDNKDIIFILSQIHAIIKDDYIKNIIIEAIKKNNRHNFNLIERKLEIVSKNKLPSEEYNIYFYNTSEIIKNMHLLYESIKSRPDPVINIKPENIFLCLESFFDRDGRFLENICNDTYDRIVLGISQKYFEPQSLSRELSREYYSPRSDGKKKKSLRKKSRKKSRK